MKTRLFLAAFTIVLSMGFISAQNGNGKGRNQDPDRERPGMCTNPVSNKGRCVDFIDENNNGICDNYENGTCAGGNCNGTGEPIGTRPQDGSGQQKGKNN